LIVTLGLGGRVINTAMLWNNSPDVTAVFMGVGRRNDGEETQGWGPGGKVKVKVRINCCSTTEPLILRTAGGNWAV